MQSFERNGRTVHLIDTPGFDDSRKDDATIMQELAFWLLQAHRTGFNLSGLVYLHRITDGRLQGSGLRALKVFKAMCGEHCYSGMVMATTRWDEITGSAGWDHQDELVNNAAFWGDIIAGGGRVMPLHWNNSSALAIIDHILENPRLLTLAIQSELALGDLALHETAAGRIIYEDYHKFKLQWEKQIQDTKIELDIAVHEHHDRNQIDCRNEIEDLQTRVNARTAALQAFRATGDQIMSTWMQKIAQEMGVLTAKADNKQQVQKLEGSRQQLMKDSRGWINNVSTAWTHPDYVAVARARQQGRLSGQYFSDPQQVGALAGVMGVYIGLGSLTLALQQAATGASVAGAAGALAPAAMLCTMM